MLQGYLMSYPDAFLPMDDYISYDDFAAYKKDMLSYDGAGYGVPFDTGVADYSTVQTIWKKSA